MNKGFNNIRRIPRYLWYRYVKKRVPFTYETVAGAELARFSARFYIEIKLLNEAIGDYHAKRSIEIGCGYGRLTPWIADHSDHHYAIEPESDLLDKARKYYPYCQFHQTSAQKLPFNDRFFDLCVCWTVLMHIPPSELFKATKEIQRVCDPQAIIILAEGVGNKKNHGFWQHSIEEWKNLLLPWKLTWYKPSPFVPTVMRFERNNS